ncbi:hypothetical protein GCM10010344_39040 [Streptomyces bluensis]|nr:hypothetical protein GCM10010344_39040 [Streptomyces bluensis]
MPGARPPEGAGDRSTAMDGLCPRGYQRSFRNAHTACFLVPCERPSGEVTASAGVKHVWWATDSAG